MKFELAVAYQEEIAQRINDLNKVINKAAREGLIVKMKTHEFNYIGGGESHTISAEILVSPLNLEI